ncbi:MAG: DUF3017 domain-containing protein [Mycobacterium sp.]
MNARRLTRKVVVGQWPILLVMAIFSTAFALVVNDFWRRGALTIGIGVCIAAVLRLALPAERAGLLVVRSKAIDVVTMALVGVAMLYIAGTVDPLGTK